MKFGVIGLGHWGTKVAKEYIALKNEGIIDSLILCDIDNNRLKQYANDAILSSNLDEVILKVDGIHICTPNKTHYEIAKKALGSGVNVLVEKPMTMNHDHAYELVEIAIERDLILQVGHIYRFANAIKKIKELYESDYFGNIYYFNLTWSHHMPYIEDVDVLWDLLPHPLDILNFITKKWPLKFIGVGRAFRRSILNEVASLQAIFDNETFANINVSWLNPIRRRILEVVGQKCTAHVECDKQRIKIYKGDSEEPLNIDVNNTIRDQILNFINAMKTGKNNFNSGIIGARTVEMIERAINSIR